MSDTVFHPIGASLPKSSDQNKDPWVGGEPNDLLRRGYTDHVGFYPKQAQQAKEENTASQDLPDANVQAHTGIAYQDGTPTQLRIPDPQPELRNWVTMHALQEWEGHVVEVRVEDFIARLRDITSEVLGAGPEDSVEEEATIPLSELPEADLTRIQPGTVFRWVIGYQRAASGTKKRISEIVVRDLPSITEQDTAQGADWATRVMRLFQE